MATDMCKVNPGIMWGKNLYEYSMNQILGEYIAVELQKTKHP